jgi:hypothetical protein
VVLIERLTERPPTLVDPCGSGYFDRYKIDYSIKLWFVFYQMEFWRGTRSQRAFRTAFFTAALMKLSERAAGQFPAKAFSFLPLAVP